MMKRRYVETEDVNSPWSPVPTQSIRKIISQNEDMQMDVITPSAYEEDRTAKIKDLATAQGLGVITHRRMAEQTAKELNFEQYEYEAEMRQIKQEEATVNQAALGLADSFTGAGIGPDVQAATDTFPHAPPILQPGVRKGTQPPGMPGMPQPGVPGAPGMPPGAPGMPPAATSPTARRPGIPPPGKVAGAVGAAGGAPALGAPLVPGAPLPGQPISPARKKPVKLQPRLPGEQPETRPQEPEPTRRFPGLPPAISAQLSRQMPPDPKRKPVSGPELAKLRKRG